MTNTQWDSRRRHMVQHDLQARGIRDARVLAAMASVPRERFVPESYQSLAYADGPVPIGEGQTVSQPYIVALMTEALGLRGGERVLEIGTGSGYQTAILLELGARVWTIERVARLSRQAGERLAGLGHPDVHLRVGDGTLGWPDEAPFDRIIATGSLPHDPAALLDQLIDGGVLVAPIGGREYQELTRIVYHGASVERRILCECRFVPLLGEQGWRADRLGRKGEA